MPRKPDDRAGLTDPRERLARIADYGIGVKVEVQGRDGRGRPGYHGIEALVAWSSPGPISASLCTCLGSV